MKAVMLVAPHQIEIVDILEPRGEYIDVEYVGICGSDIAAYLGRSSLITYPRILGHEIGGKYVGNGVLSATMVPYTSRTRCNCNACLDFSFNACKYSVTMGVQEDGGMTEKISVNQNRVRPNCITSSMLTPLQMTLIEPLSVGRRAFQQAWWVSNRVLIIGGGAVGIGAAMTASNFIKKIDVFLRDPHQGKRKVADEFFKVRTSGFHSAYELVIDASSTAKGLRYAIEMTDYHGEMVQVSYPGEVNLDTTHIPRKEMTIHGSRNANGGNFEDTIQQLRYMDKPTRDAFTSAMIEKIYPVSQVRDALEHAAAGTDKPKIIIDMKKW